MIYLSVYAVFPSFAIPLSSCIHGNAGNNLLTELKVWVYVLLTRYITDWPKVYAVLTLSVMLVVMLRQTMI